VGTKINRPAAPPPPQATAPETAPRAPAEAPATAATPTWNVKTVNVDGAPRRVDMRMGTDPASLAAQQQMPIACPVLKALKEEGKIHVDPQGRVKTDEMLQALKEKGLTPPMLEVLRGISYFANEPKDIPRNIADQSFDIMHLRSGLTMHDADSNVLSRGPFDEAAFSRFAAHAKNGYLDADGFAAAIADQTKGDLKAQNPLVAATFGQNAVLAEYPVLLKLFNSTDPSGKPAVPVEALKAFWKDGTLPGPSAAPGSIGLANTARAYASMLMKADAKLVGDAFGDLLTATGLARAGVRLSNADDDAQGPRAAATAGTGAGKAASCPYLAGGAAMKTPLNANVDLHSR
jgi:hypothetical protein